jgi:hypothetical protein
VYAEQSKKLSELQAQLAAKCTHVTKSNGSWEFGGAPVMMVMMNFGMFLQGGDLDKIYEPNLYTRPG